MDTAQHTRQQGLVLSQELARIQASPSPAKPDRRMGVWLRAHPASTGITQHHRWKLGLLGAQADCGLVGAAGVDFRLGLGPLRTCWRSGPPGSAGAGGQGPFLERLSGELFPHSERRTHSGT